MMAISCYRSCRQAASNGEGQLQREILPNGEPIELVILADTSASIDVPSRQRQADLIAALLDSLTSKDKFNLATCDVDCRWVFAKAAAADAKNIEMARQKLAAERSLGWTDLDKAFQACVGPKRAEHARRLYRRWHRHDRRRRSGSFHEAAAEDGRTAYIPCSARCRVGRGSASGMW